MIMRRLSPNLVRALRHVTATIALSLGIKQRLELAGFGGPIVAIPNGVDTGRFVPRAKTPNTVLAVGKNVRRKRLSDIASFFLSRPDYHLTICGPGADTDLPGRRIPRGPNVHVLGNQSEEAIAARLGASEYFVHLAEQEGSALAVREAMAAGCKVWTTPSNAQDLAHVAVHWEAAVRDHGLGERARHEAVTTFDWQAIVRRTVEVYREAIARFERRPR
jgi:glycosyltransferase involved in cell wall biosynthesis